MSIVWIPAGKRSLVYLPKEWVDVDEVRTDLTLSNPAYWQQRSGGHRVTEEPTIELYRETSSHIAVPRHYEIPWRGRRRRVVDLRKLSTSCKPIRHKIKLRDEVQEEASQALLESDNDKIIALACGKGKTVVSLHAASEGERFPVLIVVPTNALRDQWMKEISDKYGIPESEIGHVQGKVKNWKGKKIAVAMLHSLCLKKYPRAFYKHWRLVVFDEVHKLGAKLFMRAASMLPCERWGLSATVAREDKMDKVFRLHLGKVVYKNLKQPLKPAVYFIETGIALDMGKYIFRGGRVNMGRLYTRLSEHPARNRRILHWLEKAINDGRTILVLGERLSQLHEINETLQNEGHDSALHVGSMSREEREDALTRQIVVATQHLAKEGLDRPAFDTLFILIPFGGFGRLQQSIGRILRLYSDKKRPLVFVFVDDIGIIAALGNKMRRALIKLKFKSKTIGRSGKWKKGFASYRNKLGRPLRSRKSTTRSRPYARR